LLPDCGNPDKKSAKDCAKELQPISRIRKTDMVFMEEMNYYLQNYVLIPQLELIHETQIRNILSVMKSILPFQVYQLNSIQTDIEKHQITLLLQPQSDLCHPPPYNLKKQY